MDGLQLRQNILDELEFDPSINAAHIGLVTITGHVSSYLEEVAVVETIQRVKAVRAVAQQIEARETIQISVRDSRIRHDEMILDRFDHIFDLRDGRLVDEPRTPVLERHLVGSPGG